MKYITSAEERLKVIVTLSQAFAQNKSVLQLTGTGANQNQRRFYLMDYAISEALEYGKVVSDDSGNAYAIIIFKDRKRFSFSSLLRNLKFIFRVIGLLKVPAVLYKEKFIADTHKAHFGISALYYVWFIGVLGNAQGRDMARFSCRN
ncbi:hypothetical protein [Pedobacter paludis]|uniref:Uncharacterized protein n=1 Tax=Pedobacter paludis TaxID=2203212 RepID=A0A317F463_9SPHI|nr:hypothetical protein [Pedobacter paludis]PWS33352.1 hypothetical protein DF947_01625 [Pedobacter paludis]